MNLTKRKLVILIIIGAIIFFSSLYLFLTRMEVEEEVVTSEHYIYYPLEQPPRLDYNKFSQQVAGVVGDFWLARDWESQIEETFEESQRELRVDKKLFWLHTQQQVKLPFPVDAEWDLDNVLAELKSYLEELGAETEIKERSTIEGMNRALLEVSIYSEYIDDEVIVYSLELLQPEVKAEMAFIIDDFGFNWLGLDEILSIERPITAAVLPFLSGTSRQAEELKEVGYEIILHLPMEAISDVDPGPGAVYVHMSPEEIREQVQESIDNLGVEIVGVNNHMGSKATGDQEVMEVVLNYLHQQGLYFVDSSTAPKSVVWSVAAEVGIPQGANYLFIDNIDQQEAVAEQIDKLSKVALDRGRLITIGHVRANTALAIKEMIPILEERGIRLVYASELVN